MSLSLWMLLAFAGWTLLVLAAGVGVRRWILIFKGRAELTSFPGDTPHGSEAYRRSVRAHANCVENLPVFGSVVLVAEAAGLGSPRLDLLAVVTMVARVAQTSVHMLFTERNETIALRFLFFLVQVLAMFGMAMLVVVAATRHGAG
jgi:uncharacterized MAPEG superfamily protein